MKGASTSVADRNLISCCTATEVASPVVAGAAVLTAYKSQRELYYANEFASPGASTLIVEELQKVLFYATEVASPILSLECL